MRSDAIHFRMRGESMACGSDIIAREMMFNQTKKTTVYRKSFIMAGGRGQLAAVYLARVRRFDLNV